jgi:N-dimethylarginine dimethylaminohydrolase
MTLKRELTDIRLSCYREYSRLKTVLMCPPVYFHISEVINEVQRANADREIDREKAKRQFENVVKTLAKHGVEVILLESDPEYSDQVYTRDIACVLGKEILLANMKESVRKGEETELVKRLKKWGLPYIQVDRGSVEGGDILIDGDQVWIGLSGRTTKDAVDALEDQVPYFSWHRIPLAKKYLHLDCILSILSPTEAIVYPPAFSAETLAMLSSRWELIPVTEEEQFGLAVNVLSIGNKVVLSQPQFGRLNRELRRRGYEVEEVDISEIIKGGGAFRCITLPLVRE